MHVPLCLCAILPRIDHATRVVVLAHPAEWDRPSNTGRVAVLTLRRAELAMWRTELDLGLLLRDGHEHLLLHPAGSPLSPITDRPVSLIVPDGTWRETSRIARRLMALPNLRRVRLVSPPRAGLRDAPSPDRLGTADAIADALETLGERDAARSLRDALRVMKDRSLWTRGKLHASQVAGGLPLEVRRAMSAPWLKPRS
jgi:DTW domain-containing protein YfiP